MNVATGVDLVDVRRVAAVLGRHPDRFLTRHFTPAERLDCDGDPRRLAVRWAAKEATAKALGTGIGPIGWHEIEVEQDAAGAPRLHLVGAALDRAERAGISAWSISLSHTDDQAIAVVVGVGLGSGQGSWSRPGPGPGPRPGPGQGPEPGPEPEVGVDVGRAGPLGS